MLTDTTSIVVPKNPTEFWTMVAALATLGAFGATIVVAVMAKMGLNALVLSKKDMKTRATREARVCAIQRCEQMATDIIPLMNKVFAAAAGAKVALFVRDLESVKFDGAAESASVPRAQAWVASLPLDMQRDMIAASNLLEGWAMYFNHELADHDLALDPVGYVFLQFVMYLYGGLITQRAGNTSGRYANVVKLFNLWYHKKKADGKTKQLEELSSEINRLNTEGPKMPKPLGLDD